MNQEMAPSVPTTVIFSTGNIITTGRTSLEKSNQELLSSLRQNFKDCKFSGKTSGSIKSDKDDIFGTSDWIVSKRDVIYVPGLSESTGLSEDRHEYDITGVPVRERRDHTSQALEHVLRELHVVNVDLLIASLPDVSFDADDDSFSQEPTADQVREWKETYSALEDMLSHGKVGRIGLAEFGAVRLGKLLPHISIRPSVDQINVRDCCVVPKPLIVFAREQKIELLTHNDCTDILPTSALGDLLNEDAETFSSFKNIEPKWVAKYTAVIQDRGVVENKGYFAMASMDPLGCIQ